jgi:hypothetical protein
MFGVCNVARAGQLIAFLSVFASPLPVPLSGDRRVTAVRASDPPRREHEVDRAEHILHAVAVMFDAARMHQETCLRGAPPLGGLADRFFRDAGHLSRARGRPFLHRRSNLVKADGGVVDEIVVEPIVFDHQMQNAVEERDIAPGLDRQKEIARARDRRDARINDDDLRAVLARLPHVVGRDRRAFADVRAADPHDLRAENITPRICRAVNPERLLVARRCAHHAQATIVINVRRLERDARELAHQVRFLRRETRAAEQTERRRAILGLNPLNLRRDARNRVVVSDLPKTARRGWIAPKRVQQTVRVRTLQVPLDAFGAQFAFVERKFHPRLKADHLIIFY